MANYCGDCVHLDENDKRIFMFTTEEYYCKEIHKYCEKGRKACSDKFIQKQKKSSCYITTIVCEILGYPDDCEVLNILRDFRKHSLQPNQEMHLILQEYDQIGPLISDNIKIELEKEKFAMELLKAFLIPCVQSIKAGNNEEAIAIYKNMVNMLKTRYGLLNVQVDYNLATPVEDLGKGRMRISPNPAIKES